MKLSKWAKEKGVTYQTAWNLFNAGKIDNAYQLKSGTIIVDEHKEIKYDNNVAIYARVSSAENKVNLDYQAERLINYCNAKGYQVTKIVKETASGLNDKRPKLEKLLLDKSIRIIVVENKDRLARFGINYIEKLLALDNRKIEIVNVATNDRDDLMQDFVSIITSFTARLYGQRRTKAKAKKILNDLENDN